MFSPLFRILTLKRRLSILIYHQVLPEYDYLRPNEVTAALFEQHLQWLKAHFNVLTLADAVDKMAADQLPPNAAVITFDDGYEDNASTAVPLLNKYQLPATFFIASDFLNGGAMWNDKVLETVRGWKEPVITADGIEGEFTTSSEEQKYHSSRALLEAFKYMPWQERLDAVNRFADKVPQTLSLMMTDEQVLGMREAGMEIGGHTCSHPILATLNADDIYEQVVRNKRYLENILGETITSFAYPNGKPGRDYNQDAIEMVKKAGYQRAVSTSYGVSDRQTDRYQIPRFTPWRNDRNGFLSLLAKNYFTQPDYA